MGDFISFIIDGLGDVISFIIDSHGGYRRRKINSDLGEKDAKGGRPGS